MSLQIRQRPLPYSTALTQRDLGDVDLAVIHCTELPELSDARTMGEKIRYAGSGTGNSGHFYIDRNGQVENWVPVERVAHHVRGFNERSIGIELVNRGRYPHWWHADHQQMTEHYTVEQMASLSVLAPRRGCGGGSAVDPGPPGVGRTLNREIPRRTRAGIALHQAPVP